MLATYMSLGRIQKEQCSQGFSISFKITMFDFEKNKNFYLWTHGHMDRFKCPVLTQILEVM